MKKHAFFLKDIDEHCIDAVFVVPVNVDSNDVLKYVIKNKGEYDCLERIKEQLPPNWEFYDRFTGNEIFY